MRVGKTTRCCSSDGSLAGVSRGVVDVDLDANPASAHKGSYVVFSVAVLGAGETLVVWRGSKYRLRTHAVVNGAAAYWSGREEWDSQGKNRSSEIESEARTHGMNWE